MIAKHLTSNLYITIVPISGFHKKHGKQLSYRFSLALLIWIAGLYLGPIDAAAVDLGPGK